MKNVSNFIVISLLIFSHCFFSCKKNNEIQGTVVYTAGYKSRKPLVTKDGAELLPHTITYEGAYLSGIDISSTGNVYTCGTEEAYDPITTDFHPYGSYWKNGTKQSFTTPLQRGSTAHDIKVLGNDIFVAGSNINKAVVWKNGVANYLTDGTNYATAFTVFVIGSDVFVGGAELNPNFKYVAKIWKNGNPLSILSDGTYSTYVNSIFVNGTDIYACGTENIGSSSNLVVWKNGVKSYLSTGKGRVHKVIVIGNDVYVAGFEYLTGTLIPLAKYWKNGVPVTIGQGYSSSISSIAVKNGDVYVAGYEKTLQTSLQVAKYWKNGVPVLLSDGSSNAAANAIVVK